MSLVGVAYAHITALPKPGKVDVWRRHGISDATFYKWKAKYGGMDVSEAKRLKALEDESARLKKLLAEAMLGNTVLKDPASKNGDARREAGSCPSAREYHRLSKPRACHLVGMSPSVARGQSMRPDDALLRRVPLTFSLVQAPSEGACFWLVARLRPW